MDESRLIVQVDLVGDLSAHLLRTYPQDHDGSAAKDRE